MQVEPSSGQRRSLDIEASEEEEEPAHKYQMIEVLEESFTIVEAKENFVGHEKELTVQDLDMDEVRLIAKKHGFDPKQTEIGILRELKSLADFKAYLPVAIDQVPQGATILGSTLVLTEKLIDGTVGVKARVCAQDFNTAGKRDDVFSPTPNPLLVRLILVLTAKFNLKIVLGDYSTAFLHAWLDEDLYMYPPKVVSTRGQIYNKVWKLLKALYGVRRSPQLFYRHLKQVLQSLGFQALKSDPCMFWKPPDDQGPGIFLVVHVDDLLVAGREQQVEWVFEEIQKGMLLKKGATIEQRPVKFLGEMIRRCEEGFEIWLDSSYYAELFELLGLGQARAVSTPLTKDIKPSTSEEKFQWEKPLDQASHHLYRQIVGKLRFAVPRRLDLLYAVYQVSRHLAQPLLKHWLWLKHIVRYLINTVNFRQQLFVDKSDRPFQLEVWSDSDYGTDEETRRSVSCCIMKLNGATVYGHSRQQTVVATSSAEAEYYAMAGATVEALGVRSLLLEIHQPVETTLRCDSSSGRALANRQGFGRSRHVDIKMLWLQSVVQSIIRLAAVSSKDNPADIGTKIMTAKRLRELTDRIDLYECEEEDDTIQLLEEDDDLVATFGDQRRTYPWAMWFKVFWHSMAVFGIYCVFQFYGKCCKRRRQTQVRDVQTQSQVTYRRDLQQPRFQPLGERDQGAWSESVRERR